MIREPSVSSLYTAIPFHQDASVLIIGERPNANGPKAFRGAMLGGLAGPGVRRWHLAHAAVVYGYFPAVSEGDDVVVLTEPKPDAPERYRFTFLRQQRGRFLCIADFANELFASDSDRDYLEVHGIGVQLTEALAEYWHRHIREELTFSGDRAMAAKDPETVEEYFKLGYRGARFAFGYGACPNLDDRAKMMELLEPDRIGVTLSEELQLHLEQSTDAFVLHHPEAKYFNV